jgi:hypothetical protein
MTIKNCISYLGHSVHSRMPLLLFCSFLLIEEIREGFSFITEMASSLYCQLKGIYSPRRVNRVYTRNKKIRWGRFEFGRYVKSLSTYRLPTSRSLAFTGICLKRPSTASHPIPQQYGSVRSTIELPPDRLYKYCIFK